MRSGAGRRTGGGGGRRGQRSLRLPAPVRNSQAAPPSTETAATGRQQRPEAQPNEKLRELNSEPILPATLQVYCTKIGTTRPKEMYIIGAHMDGIGKGEAANDDGSGTALVMEMARIFSSPDVTTDVSIRFALWNSEESGLNGARAYVEQREKLQGIENPPGSGKYPEPKWLGMIQHDMMMFDHGMPRADGSLSPEQRPEADVNIEFQSTSKMADESMKLAFAFKPAADTYTTDYPGTLGPHMTNTDSGPFMDIIAADQPARKRARHEHRRRLESALASADGPLHDVLRQGFPAGPQRGAGHARGDRSAQTGAKMKKVGSPTRGRGPGTCEEHSART